MSTQQPPRLVLNAQTLRLLGDRSYDKRKQAAIEIEHLIRDLNPNQGTNTEKIKQIIQTLIVEYAYSSLPNNRKGGLIGLSAIAIALGDNASGFLEVLLPPVLKCFSDMEPRVRYYACEAMYNITKVTRSQVLVFFNEIFDGLCKLAADKDVDVKSAAQLLDRLIKDVVSEGRNFQVERFIPLLRERLRIKNPFIRQLLVSWVVHLDSIPSIDMLEFLPEYLGGLFDMLSDSNRDIRQQAYSALSELLQRIISSPFVSLGSMVLTLVHQASHKDHFTRLTVLTWILEFIVLGRTKLLRFVPELLSAIFFSLAEPEREIRAKAQQAHEVLLRLIQTTPESELEANVDVESLLRRSTSQLNNQWAPTRLAALRWVLLVLTKLPDAVHTHLDTIVLPALLLTLQDVDDHVVRCDLEILARISIAATGGLNMPVFRRVLQHLLKLFRVDLNFLEARGSLIVRQLAVFLGGEHIYCMFAELLADVDDVELSSLLVQSLNLILLTAPEFMELRSKLKVCLETPAGRELFTGLMRTWCHNPIAALSLALYCESYALAEALAMRVACVDVTVGLLMQADKLVQLLESPIFVHVRLRLLDLGSLQNQALLRTLYAVAMMLPQSAAFTSLRQRLDCIGPLNTLLMLPKTESSQSKTGGSPSKYPWMKYASEHERLLPLESIYERFCSRTEHADTRRRMLAREASLMDHVAATTPVATGNAALAAAAAAVALATSTAAAANTATGVPSVIDRLGVQDLAPHASSSSVPEQPDENSSVAISTSASPSSVSGGDTK